MIMMMINIPTLSSAVPKIMAMEKPSHLRYNRAW